MTCGALDPARKETGRRVYNARCYFCHGYRGDGNTAAARYLDPRPRDFTAAVDLDAGDMRTAIANGRPGTAMQGFGGLLTAAEIEVAVDFIAEEFIRCHGPNTRYHTAANGWPEHEIRNAAAFPFVSGALPADAPSDRLTPDERTGQAIFRASCIVCHEGRTGPIGGQAGDEGDADDEAHEYDRAAGVAEGTAHDRAPVLIDATPQEELGARLYQENCALCHAADCTGRNWIGGFLQPHPPDFTRPGTAADLDDARLRQAIVAGLPNTSMPAFGPTLSADHAAAIAAYMRRAFFR